MAVAFSSTAPLNDWIVTPPSCTSHPRSHTHEFRPTATTTRTPHIAVARHAGMITDWASGTGIRTTEADVALM
jgi:hypothetical protein